MKFPETKTELDNFELKIEGIFGHDNVSDVSLKRGEIHVTVDGVPMKISNIIDSHGSIGLERELRYTISNIGATECLGAMCLEFYNLERIKKPIEAVIQFVEYCKNDIPAAIAIEMVCAKYTLTDKFKRMNVSRLNPLMDKDFLFDCINNDIKFKELHPEIKEGKLYLSIENLK